MGIFGNSKYIKCVQEQDGTLSCLKYKPTRDGKRIITATMTLVQGADCVGNVTSQDGDPKDLADLEEHLSKRVRNKCKQPSEM